MDHDEVDIRQYGRLNAELALAWKHCEALTQMLYETCERAQGKVELDAETSAWWEARQNEGQRKMRSKLCGPIG